MGQLQKVVEMDDGQFRTVTETFRNHYDTILNYFINRSTNAGAESFNAKVKAFRSQFRGVTDIPFFLFRLAIQSSFSVFAITVYQIF